MALWSGLHRSVPLVGSPLLIRRPYATHALVSIEEHALLSILPAYARESHRRPYDADAIVQELVLDSPELWPRTTVNPLRDDEISDVYYWIIRTTSRSSYDEVDSDIAGGITVGLEECLRLDSCIQRTSYHRRAQHLFRALADVSCRTQSHQIGSVLADFFLSNVVSIARTAAPDILGQWCFAILRAHVQEIDRLDCLRRVLRERPELPSRLIGRGSKAEEVLQRFVMISTQDTRSGPSSRVGSLLGLDIPSFPFRARSLSRSNAYDAGLLPPTGARTRVDGVQEAALERLILAHENAAKRGRRMLQLTMGRRYVDRFDGPQADGLAALMLGGPGDDRYLRSEDAVI